MRTFTSSKLASTIIAAGAALAFASFGAHAAGSGSSTQNAATQAQSQTDSVWIDGQEMAASSLVGKKIFTENNEQIGEIAAVSRRDGSPRDIIIRIDEKHSAMALTAGKRPSADSEPAIIGNTMTADLQSLSPRQNGSGLTIDTDALPMASDLRFDEEQGAWVVSSAAGEMR